MEGGKRTNLGAQSLLVPAHGFDSMGEAKEYWRLASCHQLDYSHPAIILGERNRKVYVTMPGYWFDTNTHVLQAKQDGTEEHVSTLLIELRSQCDPRPGYPICLLASGRLKYNCQMGADSLPSWVRWLTNGQRDCYACWQQADGRPFCVVARLNSQPGSVAIHAARAGRGAAYARTAVLDRSGQLVGYSVVRARLEFSVLSKDPNKDDMLKVKIGRTVTREEAGDSPHINGLALDEQWKQLMAQAQQGFLSSGCQCLPDEVESDRLSIVDQVAKFKADAELAPGQRFRDLVGTLSWQDALKLVGELWQMEVVRRVHLQPAVQPQGRALWDMIQRLDCQEKHGKSCSGWPRCW